MLTRRRVLATASAFCVSTTSARHASAAGPKPKETIAFEVPHGACDTHVHVVGEPAEFPMSPERDYTPPAATADGLIEALRFLNFDRVVIVTPTIYGDDNTATIAAIRQIGRDRARGIALVDQSASPAILDAMMDEGIVGVRLFLYGGGVFDPAAAAKRLQAKIDLARRRGWHIQISTPPDVIAALATQLAASSVPLVLEYFGWLAGGVDQPGFEEILSLVKSGRAYVKLAEPYRLSKNAPDYPDLVPVVQALVAANPDRVLWGSGWPHVDSGHAKADVAPNLPVDAGHLLNLLAAWVPDADNRRKILVDNPARLYGF
jgi:predicted TIM-barrel fold metal-dependent hydrolase